MIRPWNTWRGARAAARAAHHCSSTRARPRFRGTSASAALCSTRARCRQTAPAPGHAPCGAAATPRWHACRSAATCATGQVRARGGALSCARVCARARTRGRSALAGRRRHVERHERDCRATGHGAETAGDAGRDSPAHLSSRAFLSRSARCTARPVGSLDVGAKRSLGGANSGELAELGTTSAPTCAPRVIRTRPAYSEVQARRAIKDRPPRRSEQGATGGRCVGGRTVTSLCERPKPCMRRWKCTGGAGVPSGGGCQHGGLPTRCACSAISASCGHARQGASRHGKRLATPRGKAVASAGQHCAGHTSLRNLAGAVPVQ